MLSAGGVTPYGSDNRILNRDDRRAQTCAKRECGAVVPPAEKPTPEGLP